MGDADAEGSATRSDLGASNVELLPNKRARLQNDDRFGNALFQAMDRLAPAAVPASESPQNIAAINSLQAHWAMLTTAIRETTDDAEKDYLKHERDITNARLTALRDKMA